LNNKKDNSKISGKMLVINKSL